MKIKYKFLYISIAINLFLISSCVIYINPPERIPDTTPPAVTISSPKASDSCGRDILVMGTASDPSGVNKVYITADGLNYTNEITGLDGITWSSSLTLANQGINTIRVWAADNKNNTSTPISISITANFSFPSITINNPADGSYVYDSPYNITGTAFSSIGISKVEVMIDSGSYTTASGTANWTNQVTLSLITHTVKARAISTDNKTNETPYISFTYRQAVWNIMVYMDGDNDLEQFALWNFNEMECVSDLTNGKVNVFVLFDRSPSYDSSDGNWTGTRLYQVKYDPTGMNNLIQSKRLSGVINGVTLQAIGDNEELNMGDPQTLADFVIWVTNNYKAQYSFLVLWDHGDGWKTGPPLINTSGQILFANFISGEKSIIQVYSNGSQLSVPYKGVCNDFSSSWDELLNSEIRSALNGKGLTVIGFDACLMGMIEAVYEFKDLAQYMIASPDEEPGYGWNYEDWLARFCASTLSPEALVTNVIDSYHSYYNNQSTMTMAAYKLSAFDQLTNAFNTYVSNLSYDLWNPGHINKSINHLSNIILLTEQYYYNSELNTDVWDLANHINVTGYNVLKNAVTNFVFYEWHNPAGDIFSGNPNSHGLALYFSSVRSSLFLDSTYINNPGIFFTQTKWVDYLTNLYSFPPNQWLSNLQVANNTIGPNESFKYQFYVTNTGWVTINLSVPAGNNDDLYLFYNGSQVTQSTNGSLNEKITFNIASTGWYIIEVTNIVYSSPNSYALSLSNTGVGPGAGIK